MTAYLQLEQRAERWWLGAARSSGLARVWDLGPGETPANHHVAPDLAEYLRTTDLIVTYSATTLVNWLSNPAVWGQTGVLLERLVDAQEVALFVAPTLRDYSLKAFCEAHHIPPPSTATSSTFRTQWETLSQRLRERTLSLPSAVRGLVASVAGDIWSEGLLGRRPVLPLLPGPALLGILSRRPHRGSGRPAAEVPNLQEAVVAALSPQGPVAQEHRAYEHRPGQIEMARSVAAAFEREELLLIEAGTGTGKSLAYLIPAILFARTTGMPVLISTNTKHLQDQLLQRDLPLANKALGVRFRAELVKGRSNYLCPRLLAAAVERVRKTAFREERLALAHLIAWAAQVEVAEVDALAPAAYEIAPALRQLVAQVRARNESCSGPKCSYFQNCPVEVVRARAQNANLVVVNHALLLASRETSILPECRHIVIDEAHNLEEVATAQLGYEISEASLRALVRLLEGETGEAIGERLTSWLTGQEHSDEVLAHEIRTTFRERVVELECTLQDFARAVLEFALDALCSDPSCPDQTSIRLTTDVRERQSWQEVVRVWPAVERAIDELAEWLRRVVQTVLEGEERLDETLAILLLDIEQIQSRLAQLSRSLAIIGGNEHNRDYVCWMTASKNQSEETSWILRAAPLEVGPALRTALYQDAQTIVMTSATLTVEGSFDFIRQRLGLEEERNRLLEQTVASPFDFDHQLLLCVPSDLPLPTEAAFEPASHAAIVEVARAARGGTLCLFTSRESMLRAYEETANPLREAGLVPISQDHAASRTAALEALREDPSVVLFGVKSLWEGIDVPGEALRCLIVVKLPFAVPSDPLIQARQERMEEEGLNGYDAYYVPHAVIGFRQGIGRLIRTRTDRGAVFVLDRRILVRRYGARFLQSLPPGRVMRGSLRECVETARGFWGGETCS